jgi:hypothetical protein
MKLQYFVLTTSSTPCADPVRVDVARVDAQALGQRHAVLRQALAHLMRRREGVLGRDVVAVGAQAAEVGGPGGDELRPPVGEVGRHLDADVGHQAPRLGHQALHVLDPHGRRPLGQVAVRCVGEAGAPEPVGRVGGDLGRLLAVVAAVGDEVLQDHLLQVAVLGVHRRQGLQRGHAVVLGLADADEDPAGERDAQLAGGADGGQALRGLLGRRALVGDEVGVDRLEHQPLRRGDLAQAAEVGGREHTEVGVGQQAALEPLLAGPHDVGGEVLEAPFAEPLPYARGDGRAPRP